jgi:hypothetical protein
MEIKSGSSERLTQRHSLVYVRQRHSYTLAIGCWLGVPTTGMSTIVQRLLL